MPRKCKIHFTASPVGSIDLNGTCTLTEFPVGEFAITWTLLDNSTSDKFYKTIQAQRGLSNRFINWNKYESAGQFDQTAPKLNAELDYCRDRGYVNFTDDFYVYSDQDWDERHRRLNAIHFAFETELYKHQTNGTSTDDFLVSLERLNKLVHECEGDHLTSQLFYVIRDSGLDAYPACDDDDYNRFEVIYNNGNLFSDFFTVGKDLGTAYYTDDVELVKRGEVKQQSFISGSVCIEFNPETFMQTVSEHEYNELYTDYHAWCSEVDALKHGYQFTQPKYRLGRVCLGVIEDRPLNYFISNLRKYPHVCNIEVYEE